VPNASTVRRQVSGTQQLTLASLAGTTITTTATPFVLNNNALTGVGGGLVPLAAGNTGIFLGTGQVIHVAITGSYSGATAGTSTIRLELIQITAAGLAAAVTTTLAGQQAAVTASGSTKIADSAALTCTQAAGSFTLDARVQLDASGNLEGQFTADIDSATVAAWQTLSTVATGLAEVDLNFFGAVILGTPTGMIVTANEIRIDLE